MNERLDDVVRLEEHSDRERWLYFFVSSRRRHAMSPGDGSVDVWSSDLHSRTNTYDVNLRVSIRKKDVNTPSHAFATILRDRKSVV